MYLFFFSISYVLNAIDTFFLNNIFLTITLLYNTIYQKVIE